MSKRMLIEKLDPMLRAVIEDRLEGWEVVEFLQIPVEDVVEAFEDLILKNLDDIKDLVGLRNDDDDTSD